MPFKDIEKKREYQRRVSAERRSTYFDGKVCVECGSKEELELDHINPEEKTSHRIWTWAEARRQEELKKCQPLCTTCHREKTREYMKSRRKHGRTLYNYGCRCGICREAQRKHNAQRYA